MKKKIFSQLLCSLLFIATVLTFTACGTDDEPTPDPTPDPSPVLPAKIAIAYSLELGDGWWDFFDIEVSYTTAEGANETKTIHKGWTYVGKVDYNDAVSEYTFTAKATPKDNLPEIDQNLKYNFDKDAKAYAFSVNEKDEQADLLVTKDNFNAMTISGANLEKWLKVHTNLGAGTMIVKKNRSTSL